MFGKLTIYLFIALIGTAAMWYGVPIIKLPVEEYLLKPEKPTPPLSPRKDSGKRDSADVKATKNPLLPRPTENNPDHTLPRPTDITTSDATPPAPLPRDTADEAPEWGVLKNNAPCFNEKGEQLFEIKGGTVVSVYKWVDTRSGELALCSFPEKTDGDNKRVYVMRKHLDSQPYYLSETDPDAVRKLSRYYELATKIKIRENQLIKASVNANPYTAKYKSSLQLYNDFVASVSELTKKRDSATGAARARYSDQLRNMISQGKKRENNYKREKENYDQWKIKHPVNVDNDHEIVRMREEMRRIDKELS